MVWMACVDWKDGFLRQQCLRQEAIDNRLIGYSFVRNVFYRNAKRVRHQVSRKNMPIINGEPHHSN